MSASDMCSLLITIKTLRFVNPVLTAASIRYDRRLKASFKQKIELTKRVVITLIQRRCRRGRAGRLAGIEDAIVVNDEDSQFTDPGEVQEFVENRCGFLAIAIGTSHGIYKFKPGKSRSFLRYSQDQFSFSDL